MKVTGVYEIVNLATDKRYIGSASDINNRFSSHRSKLRRGIHANRHLQNAWNKYGEKSFRFRLLVKCSKDMLIQYEQMFIDKLQPEYNISTKADRREWRPGEHPRLGAKWEPGTHPRLGAKWGDNHPMLGKKHSPETIEKIRAAALRRPPMSQDVREKMSRTRKALGLKPPTPKKRSKK